MKITFELPDNTIGATLSLLLNHQHEGEPGKARKLIEDAPTVAAVPASKILALRDALYEADAVTMRGLRNLNMLIAKYEGGKDHALD